MGIVYILTGKCLLGKIAMNGGRQYLRAMTGDMRLAMRYDNLGYMGFQN